MPNRLPAKSCLHFLLHTYKEPSTGDQMSKQDPVETFNSQAKIATVYPFALFTSPAMLQFGEKLLARHIKPGTLIFDFFSL